VGRRSHFDGGFVVVYEGREDVVFVVVVVVVIVGG